jgi:MYXO-CTERM domain-containing protein
MKKAMKAAGILATVITLGISSPAMAQDNGSTTTTQTRSVDNEDNDGDHGKWGLVGLLGLLGLLGRNRKETHVRTTTSPNVIRS